MANTTAANLSQRPYGAKEKSDSSAPGLLGSMPVSSVCKFSSSVILLWKAGNALAVYTVMTLYIKEDHKPTVLVFFFLSCKM